MTHEHKPTTLEERTWWTQKRDGHPDTWLTDKRALRLIADVDRLEKWVCDLNSELDELKKLQKRWSQIINDAKGQMQSVSEELTSDCLRVARQAVDERNHLRTLASNLAELLEDHECERETGIGHECSICSLIREAKEAKR